MFLLLPSGTQQQPKLNIAMHKPAPITQQTLLLYVTSASACSKTYTMVSVQTKHTNNCSVPMQVGLPSILLSDSSSAPTVPQHTWKAVAALRYTIASSDAWRGTIKRTIKQKSDINRSSYMFMVVHSLLADAESVRQLISSEAAAKVWMSVFMGRASANTFVSATCWLYSCTVVPALGIVPRSTPDI